MSLRRLRRAWRRRAGGRRRSHARAPLARIEAEAVARRRRAQTHLARVRARRRRGRCEARWAARSGRARRVGTALALLAAACAAAAVPAAWGRARALLRRAPLSVERVAVEGAVRVPAADIAAAAGIAPGTPLLDVDPGAVRKRLLAHPWIAEVRGPVRLPPSTLVVRVAERVPLAVVAAGSGAALHLVDAEGVPFAPAGADDARALPRIATARAPEPGRASAELATAAHVAREVARLGRGAPVEISIAPAGDPEGLWFRARPGGARVVLGHGDLAEPLARYRRLLSAPRPETASAARIDLRFRDVAVLEGVPPRTGADQAAAARSGAAPSEADRPG